MADLWHMARAFAETRYRTRPGLSRDRFLHWQAGALHRWLHSDVPNVSYYAARPPRALRDLPIVDKVTMMADFGAFNRANLSARDGWRCFDTSGRCQSPPFHDISVGASTGTSGNRALYMITPQERLRWLGTILAKALPRFPFQSERVAVILPQSSDLYDTAARARRLQLEFFDLRAGMDMWGPRLAAFDPTCLVGPPRILRALAEADISLHPRTVFSSAETLDPIDRRVIEAAFSLQLGQIYMATEGLFGVSCPHGTLHLAEDAVHFEYEPAENGLVSPIISSFRRGFQIMARYRMNDLIRLADTPCPCGSPLQPVSEVVGRMDDLFIFGSGADQVLFTPDILRNAVLDADRGIDDYRIHRTGPHHVHLTLPDTASTAQLARAQTALDTLMRARHPGISLTATTAPLAPDPEHKLRRVLNKWRPETTGSTP